jgi:quinol monooxygenase YgiN
LRARRTGSFLVFDQVEDLKPHLKTPYITAMEDEFKELLAAPPERQLLVPVGE